MTVMDKYTKKNSVSDTQIKIEAYLFDKFKEEYGLSNMVKDHVIELSKDPNVTIKPDIYCEHPRIIGEIHSHLGKLKPAQIHKIAADILKMNLFEKKVGNCSKYIIICSKDEKDQLTGNSYIAEAIRQYRIKVICYELSLDLHAELDNTMRKQNMLRNHTNK